VNGLLTLADYGRAARARLPREVWDFIEGGAGDERTVAANLDAFARVRLLPRVLAGAGIAETATTLFGRTWTAPIGVAPCAYHGLVHPDGEAATVRAAGAAGLPIVLSMFSGCGFEQLAAAAQESGAVLWQQIYGLHDRAAVERLIRRAGQAGAEALVLTVDTPHLGRRLRDLRNGFRLPPHVRAAHFDDAHADVPDQHAREAHDASLDWSAIPWLRGISPLPLLLKGVLTAEDAARAVQAGVDGLIVSNHGGRQLDAAAATLAALPAVAAAAGGLIPVLVDGGVRRGTDVLAALALGASAVLVARPVLHGLAVDGQEGAYAVLALLEEELRDAMTLAGAGTVAEVGPDLVDTRRLDALPVSAAAGPPASSAARTAVAPAATQEPNTLEQPRAAPLHRSTLHSSLSDPQLDTMAFLNEVADLNPQAISFAPGRPYDGFFEIEDVFAAVRGYLDDLRSSGHDAQAVRSLIYQYGPSAGIIRDLIARSLRADEGIDADPESLVVTVGAQEAMVLVLRALFGSPRDVLLVATPCYVGIVGAARLLDVQIATVPERADGLEPADVRETALGLRRRGLRPRALYVVPDYSNPSGNTLGPAARGQLLELARELDLLVLEDSPYRLVSPGERIASLKALDLASIRDGAQPTVVQIGSFAKSAFPGARVGYALADQRVATGGGADPEGSVPLAHELARIKSMLTVNTATLSQAAVAGMLLACDGRLSERNAKAAAHYGENLRVLLEELSARMPGGGRAAGAPTWNRPRGGFFLRMDVPFPADEAALARAAADHGVLWTPMRYFYPDGGGERQLRLSFSALTPELIREGVARLARFVAAETARAARP